MFRNDFRTRPEGFLRHLPKRLMAMQKTDRPRCDRKSLPG
ncbi:hypothetical protein CSB93_4143 [Pseudomonas paraeruginosa]|uniref:Uncharacterized protein n=1 Tax=Pseudomonas paraeruginosa TaxID=2994495 RepID=A0A2R3IUR9_9PSED|nr:hypothetical protein CSB93_4143 [Pseudomonas paraeruginosa]AWE93114.1 hypothetical protein CSC28_2929 [Pseudomonas paraeruginosa]